MYNEVQKSLLSKHGDALAMSRSEAVDQMIGFEQLKRTIGGRVKNNNGDTSSAVVLLGINKDVESNEPETDEYVFKC